MQMKKKMAHDLTWRLLDTALEEFAFPMIDEMCEADFKASEASLPSDTGGPGTGGAGGGYNGGGGPGTGDPGAGYNNETGSGGTGSPGAGFCQVQYQRHLSVGMMNGQFSHTYDYQIEPCGNATTFRLLMRNENSTVILLENMTITTQHSGDNKDEPWVSGTLNTEICLGIGSGSSCEPATCDIEGYDTD